MKLHMSRMLFDFQLMMLAGIIVFQVLGKADLAGNFFTLTFFLTVLLWLNHASRRIDRKDELVLAIMALSCVSVCTNALTSGTAVSVSYFKKLLMFWTTLLFFAGMEAYPTDCRDRKTVFRWSSLLSGFLIVMYLLRRDEMYTINGIVTIYLTFGFTNPNLTAVFLASLCMLELLQGAAEQKLKRWWHWLLAGILAVFVYLTRARNAQLVLFFFLTGFFLARFLPKKRLWVSSLTAALLSGAPLLFAAGYLLLISSPWVGETFSFLVGEGKELDSRVGIWSFAVNAFANSPLVGAYSEISGGSGASQMHNSHLDLLASYGAPVMVLTWLLMASFLRGGSREGYVAFGCRLGFAALLLTGLGEAMLFSGGMGVYLFGGIFLMMKNGDFEGGKL